MINIITKLLFCFVLLMIITPTAPINTLVVINQAEPTEATQGDKAVSKPAIVKEIVTHILGPNLSVTYPPGILVAINP